MTIKEKIELCIYRMDSILYHLGDENPSEERLEYAKSFASSTKRTLEGLYKELGEAEVNVKIDLDALAEAFSKP